MVAAVAADWMTSGGDEGRSGDDVGVAVEAVGDDDLDE